MGVEGLRSARDGVLGFRLSTDRGGRAGQWRATPATTRATPRTSSLVGYLGQDRKQLHLSS
jgi:hypothetical protein